MQGSIEYAGLLIGMGIVAAKTRQLKLALGYFNRGLVIQRKLLPPDHPTIANTLRATALAHKQMGHVDEAESSTKEATAVSRRSQSACAG